MPIIAWKDCYTTGSKPCDDEHREMVERINFLYEAIRDKDAATKLPAIIEDLLKYTLTHFANEEALLTQHAYPELESHQQIHSKLKLQVEAFKEELPIKLFNFLRAWLLQHIVDVDQRYGAFLQEKGIN